MQILSIVLISEGYWLKTFENNVKNLGHRVARSYNYLQASSEQLCNELANNKLPIICTSADIARKLTLNHGGKVYTILINKQVCSIQYALAMMLKGEHANGVIYSGQFLRGNFLKLITEINFSVGKSQTTGKAQKKIFPLLNNIIINLMVHLSRGSKLLHSIKLSCLEKNNTCQALFNNLASRQNAVKNFKLKSIANTLPYNNHIGHPDFNLNVFAKKEKIQKNIYSHLSIISKKSSNKVAIEVNNIQYTYHQLVNKIEQFYKYLQEKEINFGAKVILFANVSFELIALMFALIKRGVIYIPLHLNTPILRIQQIINLSGASLIFSSKTTSKDNSYGIDLVCIEEISSLATLPFKESPASVVASSGCYIMFTSGSTGNPKGVLVTQRNILQLIFSVKSINNFYHGNRWAQIHSLGFDFSVWEIFFPLLLGRTLVIPEENLIKSPKLFLKWAKTKEIEVINITPSLFGVYIDHAIKQFNSIETLRYVIFGGECLNYKLFYSWKSLLFLDKVQYINMYGITESTVHSTYYEIPIKPIESNSSCIGVPLPGTQIILVDSYGNPVAENIVGNILISGYGLANYLNIQPSSTYYHDNYFLHNNSRFLYTGDRGFFDKNGLLYFSGRSDDVVKISGIRVDLNEINSIILKHEMVKNSITMRVKNKEFSQIISFVIAIDDVSFTENLKDSVYIFLRKTLPDYMLPGRIILVDEFLVNSSGKTDKKFLLKKIQGKTETSHENAISSRLEKIWKKLLGYSPGSNDDFFLSGGNSLLAMRLASDIDLEFKCDILYKNVLLNSKYNKLLRLIERKINKGHDFSGNLDSYPMEAAPIQELFWEIDQSLHGKSFQHNLAILFHFYGKLDENHFKDSISLLVNNNMLLRSCFVEKDKKLLIMPLDEKFFLIEEKELYDNDSIIAESRKPFNLSKDFLIRFIFIKNCQKTSLLIVMHHIIHDGWSIVNMLKELACFYNNRHVQKANNKKIDYTYFLKPISANRVKQLNDFWAKQVKKINPVFWPPDLKNNFSSVGRGARKTSRISKKSILKIATDLNISLFSILAVAYMILLSKYTKSYCVTIGILIAGRGGANLNKLIGPCFNVLPLTIEFVDEKTVKEILLLAAKELTASYIHGDFPCKKIAKLCGNNALFGTTFTFNEFHKEIFDINFNDVRIEYDFLDTKVTRSTKGLTFEAIDKSEWIDFIIEYNIDMFSDNRVDSIMCDYNKIINIITTMSDEFFSKITVPSSLYY